MTMRQLLFSFGVVLFYSSNVTCFSPSNSYGPIFFSQSKFGSSVVRQSGVTLSPRIFVQTPQIRVLANGEGAFGHPRTTLRKMRWPLIIALAAREQDDEEDDDEVEITTYLSCPKCMSDHFILKEVLGEGRHVPNVVTFLTDPVLT
jgi:hypothetical protein